MWHLLLILIGSEVAISQQYWGNFNPYYQRGFVPAPAKYFGHFPVDDEPIYQNSRFVGPQLRSQPIVYPSFPQFDQGYQQAQQPPSAIPPSTFQSYPNPPVIANPTYQPAIPAYQPSVVQPPVQPSYPNPPVIPNPTYQPPSPAYQPSVAPPPVQPSYQPSVPSYPSPSYPSPTPSSYSGNSATFNAASPLCSPQYNYGSGPVGGGYGGSQSQWGTNSGSEPVIYQGSAYFPVLPTVDLSRCFTRYTETRVKGLAPYLEATAGNVEECLVTCLASWVSYQQMCQSVVYLARTRSCQLFNATARWKPAVAYMQYGFDYYEPTNCPGCALSEPAGLLSRTTTGPEPASTGEVSTGSDVTSASTISGLPTETTSTSTESTTTSTVTVAEVVTEGAPPPEGVTTKGVTGVASSTISLGSSPKATTQSDATSSLTAEFVVESSSKAQLPLASTTANCEKIGKEGIIHEIEGQKLLKAEGFQLKDVSKETCINSCKTNGRVKKPHICLSANYDKINRICTLFEDKAIVPSRTGLLETDKNFYYIEKSCISSEAAAKCKAVSINRLSQRIMLPSKSGDDSATTESVSSMSECIEKCLQSETKCLSVSYLYKNPDNNCILSSLSSKTSPGALKNAKELNKQSEYFSFDDCSSQNFSKDKNPQKAATTVTPAITTRKLNNFSDDFNFLRNLIGATTKGGKFPAGQPLFGGGTLTNIKAPPEFRLRDVGSR